MFSIISSGIGLYSVLIALELRLYLAGAFCGKILRYRVALRALSLGSTLRWFYQLGQECCDYIVYFGRCYAELVGDFQFRPIAF